MLAPRVGGGPPAPCSTAASAREYEGPSDRQADRNGRLKAPPLAHGDAWVAMVHRASNSRPWNVAVMMFVPATFSAAIAVWTSRGSACAACRIGAAERVRARSVTGHRIVPAGSRSDGRPDCRLGAQQLDRGLSLHRWLGAAPTAKGVLPSHQLVLRRPPLLGRAGRRRPARLRSRRETAPRPIGRCRT